VKAVKDFGAFWYEFIVGDDWKIAVAVVLALVVAGLLVAWSGLGDHTLAVIGAALVAALFSLSLVVDTRGRDR
jgi:hypothetical protein